MWCYRPVDLKHPKTYIEIKNTTLDRITYSYLYHLMCWMTKRDSEAMRKYKESMRGF